MNQAARVARVADGAMREIPAPADYTDEVTPEQLDALREAVSGEKFEDWEIVAKAEW